MSRRKALKSHRQSFVVIRSRHRPVKYCRGPNTPDKVRYSRMSEALRSIQGQRITKGRQQYPYECPDCGGWHLTSQYHQTPAVGASKTRDSE